MIPKSGNRFSDKIMRKNSARLTNLVIPGRASRNDWCPKR